MSVRYTSARIRSWFFFSSRRRHTSCLSDWSSDVCSSDLRRRDAGVEEPRDVRVRQPGEDLALAPEPFGAGAPDEARVEQLDGGVALEAPVAARSEERRVGKECRSRWSR